MIKTLFTEPVAVKADSKIRISGFNSLFSFTVEKSSTSQAAASQNA